MNVNSSRLKKDNRALELENANNRLPDSSIEVIPGRGKQNLICFTIKATNYVDRSKLGLIL